MKLPLLIIALCAVFAAGDALRCYDCDEKKLRKCSGSLESVECANGGGGDYQCVSYTEHRVPFGKNYTLKHCAKKNVNFCSNFSIWKKQQGYVLLDCEVCNENYCNSAEKTKMGIILLFVVSVVKLGI